MKIRNLITISAVSFCYFSAEKKMRFLEISRSTDEIELAVNSLHYHFGLSCDRIEKMKFANKIFLRYVFLSATFLQKKMRFCGIFWSADEIEWCS